MCALFAFQISWPWSFTNNSQISFLSFTFEHIQVRYIGVSNETSYGVMEFVHAAKVEGLPKIVSIQNSYSLLVRCHFEG